MDKQQTYSVDEIKDQIRALLAQLPMNEGGQERAVLLSYQLQEELLEVLSSDGAGVKEKVTEIGERQKALDLLIEINRKTKELYEGLTDKSKEVTNLKGIGIRKHIRRKNESTGEGDGNSGIHKGAGENAQESHL